MCEGSWQTAGLVMPRVLWASFVRKDLAQNVPCNTQMPLSQKCKEDPQSVAGKFKLTGGESLRDPEGLFFDIFGQSYHPEDPYEVQYLIPHKSRKLASASWSLLALASSGAAPRHHVNIH